MYRRKCASSPGIFLYFGGPSTLPGERRITEYTVHFNPQAWSIIERMSLDNPVFGDNRSHSFCSNLHPECLLYVEWRLPFSFWSLRPHEGPRSLLGPSCLVAAGITRWPGPCVFCWPWPMLGGPSLLRRAPLGLVPLPDSVAPLWLCQAVQGTGLLAFSGVCPTCSATSPGADPSPSPDCVLCHLRSARLPCVHVGPCIAFGPCLSNRGKGERPFCPRCSPQLPDSASYKASCGSCLK